jgi:predicted dehydrogenase
MAARRFPVTDTTPPRRPRLGLVGSGGLGRDRAAAIERSGLAEVLLVADPAPAGETPAAGSFDALLEADLDGLVLATPTAERVDQAVAALERGLAVFCEKPLGRTQAESQRVVRAAREADRLLGVDLPYRHVAGMAELAELVRSGRLGPIYAVELRFHTAYGPEQPWARDRAAAGGGCLMDHGLHLLDLALWVLGFPPAQQITARRYAEGERIAPNDGPVEDYATGRIDLATGATLSLACSWKLPAGRMAVIVAAFYGTGGGGALRNRHGSLADLEVKRFRHTMEEQLATPDRDWSGQSAVEWVRRLARGERFDPEIGQAVRVAAILDEMNRE